MCCLVAVTDDPRVVEEIVCHLGAWHDPPACRSLGAGRPPRHPSQGVPGPYTYEPCDDVDPMPLCEASHKGMTRESWRLHLDRVMMQPHHVTHLLKDARCRLARPHSLCGTLPGLGRLGSALDFP